MVNSPPRHDRPCHRPFSKNQNQTVNKMLSKVLEYCCPVNSLLILWEDWISLCLSGCPHVQVGRGSLKNFIYPPSWHGVGYFFLEQMFVLLVFWQAEQVLARRGYGLHRLDTWANMLGFNLDWVKNFAWFHSAEAIFFRRNGLILNILQICGILWTSYHAAPLIHW